MLSEQARLAYAVTALENAPVIMAGIIGGRQSDDSFWDIKLSANRFSMRQVLAHLADWDEIFVTRIKRTLDEDKPTLPNIDEGEIAIRHDYDSQDPLENLARWKSNRDLLVTFIRSIPPGDFTRSGFKEPIGEIDIDGWLSMISGHDVYHLRQAVDTVAA